jgi:hypothetical protein
MLVATMVFITGFVAVFALFLAGVKMRATADLETRSAIALHNLVEEIQLDAGLETTAAKPAAYLGSGFPGTASSTVTAPAMSDNLYGCPGMPGMFYAVLEASDGDGTEGSVDSAVVTLRIVQLGLADIPDSNGKGPTWTELARRLRIDTADSSLTVPDGNTLTDETLAKLIAELVRRGIATDDRVAIVRQPSWL